VGPLRLCIRGLVGQVGRVGHVGLVGLSGLARLVRRVGQVGLVGASLLQPPMVFGYLQQPAWPTRPLRHHSFEAAFDVQKRITLQGVVTKVEWVSPHTWIYLDVKGTDGSVVNWAVEASSPGVLASRGWRRSTVLPGMFITIDAFLAKDGSPMVNGRDLTFPDGRQLCANIPCRCCRGPR